MDRHPETLSAKGLARRELLIAGAALGGGLIIGFVLPRFRDGKTPTPGAEGQEAAFSPNAFIRIDRDGMVTMVMPKAEMGQGTYTSIPMLVAEELDVDITKVRLEHAPADDKLYGDPILGRQVTGGSTSIRGAWKPLREAGATARSMLIAAACKDWNVEPGECRTENGMIMHQGSDRKIAYGDVVEAAATMPVPAKVQLKDPKDFRLIGKPVKRLDSPDKVNGKAVYGIDVRVPNMKIATVAASPVLGGKLSSVDDSKARAIKGVVDVVKLESAVAVIADNMWTAKQGLAALDIKWDGGRNAGISHADIVAQLEQASSNKGRAAPGVMAKTEGDFRKTFEQAENRFEATYQMPFLSHAALEPMNCTVHVQVDRCDVWVGTQVPTLAKDGAVSVTKMPPEKVFIHNHHIGGGFGRRLDVDFVIQAVAIAKQVNYPVKVVWTREEDMQHGIYRPYYYDRLAAALDKEGRPIAWSHRITGSSIMSRWVPQMVQNGLDPDAVEGAVEPLYASKNILVEYVRQEPPGLVTGWWRGVGVTHNIFMIESFVDELAHKAGKDPVEYRLSLIDHAPRAKAVLKLAAEKAGWGGELPKGQGRGVSVQHGFGSYVAQVVDVEMVEDEVKVKRVICVIDCGTVVNPDTVVAQMEGGILFGLSGAMWGEITVKDGRVTQSNYDNYRVARMSDSPVIEVHVVPSGDEPGGIGEPGTSALAPALTNAIFAATGKRIRTLPVQTALASA
jgi:isoquinoline 1-oxidoreductase beta subunit